MNKELIERMKQNRVPNYLLTDEEWECLKAANKWQWLPQPGAKWLDTHANTNRRLNVIHRIHPDYNPEPERKVVKYGVNVNKNGWLSYKTENDEYHLLYAVGMSNFIGYEYGDGYFSRTEPRKDNPKGKDYPAEYPKFVLFSEVQK